MVSPVILQKAKEIEAAMIYDPCPPPTLNSESITGKQECLLDVFDEVRAELRAAGIKVNADRFIANSQEGL
jgi:hypothetical protein